MDIKIKTNISSEFEEVSITINAPELNDELQNVIKYISKSGIRAKSGIMLGLGETREEVLKTMDDLLNAGCEVMTIGQYLQPTRNHFPVKEYIHPDIFAEYSLIGKEKGFRHIESHPLVRSSYHAEKHIL